MKTQQCITLTLISLLSLATAQAAPGGNRENHERRGPPSPAHFAERIFEIHDENNNDTISQTELQAALEEHEKRHQERHGGNRGNADNNRNSEKERPERPSPEELAQNLVEEFDLNQDGELNPEELLEALTEMRNQMPKPPHCHHRNKSPRPE